MTLLAVESSCDETSAAVVRDGRILSNTVSSQIRLHSEYGGVVPELATREHLRNLIPVATAALRQAGVTIDQLDAVAATRGPGLPAALMIGFQAAQTLAFVLERPFLGIQHHEAHLYSPWIAASSAAAEWDRFEPNVSLIVSGGHTMLVLVRRELEHKVLGSTLDDAAGECFDKVAKLIGLPYPGGPELDRLAVEGNPKAVTFPRPLMHEKNHDFSFSGLKTSVRYFLRDHPGLLDRVADVKDLCASVQAAIVEVLVAKTIRAARVCHVRCVTASGGVTCNRGLRTRLAEACAREGLTLRLADRLLCTDNAAMVGILAERKLSKGLAGDPFDDEIAAHWSLG
jgi:N6-L-threonylcarbamoyladenine synthase